MRKKAVLFDWGDTVMRSFPDEKGPMYAWSRVEAMPHAESVLEAMSRMVDCYIATNARDSTRQDIVKALRRVGLDSYFKGVFCFREIGCSKPSAGYFNAILDGLGLDRSDVLMVGDDLETDVEGARRLGIDAVLVDINDVHSDFEGTRVTDLEEILSLVM